METIQEKAKVIEECIKQEFDIELTWSEFVALKFYVKCFSGKEKLGIDSMQDSENQFMGDYFGLDTVEL